MKISKPPQEPLLDRVGKGVGDGTSNTLIATERAQDAFERAVGSSPLAGLMATAPPDAGGLDGLSANALALEVLLETAQSAQRDRATSREAVGEAFAARVDAQHGQKEQMEERQGAARDAAWVNVGVAFASAMAAVGGAAGASSSALLGEAAAGLRPALDDVAARLGAGDLPRALAGWEDALAGFDSSTMDVGRLTQYVLREGYLEANQELQSYAEKVKSFGEMKGALREMVAGLREQLAVATAESGEGQIVDVEEVVSGLEETLATVGDDAQLANIDLQNALQKMQQTLQTISNASKMLHDSAMAIIRKIG